MLHKFQPTLLLFKRRSISEDICCLSDLYIDQVAFPPELLRRILLMQQQHFTWISPDRDLYDPRHLAYLAISLLKSGSDLDYRVLGKFLLMQQ